MRRIALPLIAAALAGAGAASAQPTGGRDGYAAPSYPQASGPGGQQGYDRGYDDDRSAPPPGGPVRGGADQGVAEPGAPDLARDLGLGADQRAALQAYQAATVPTAAEQARTEADQRALAGMTTPQRLDAIAAQMRRDDADFARRADAVRRFYAQLTPAQQRRFDQLTGPEADPQERAANDYEGDDATGAPPPR